MKKGDLLRRTAITLAMALLMATACGGEDPPGGKDRKTAPGEARATVPDATRTLPPAPTRPGRIDHLLRTPTVTPKPAVEQGTKPESSPTSGAERGTASNGAQASGETPQPKGIEALVPEDPRTNDQVLLQDIYAQIDLEQFALDSDEPIEFRGNERRAWILSKMSYPLVHQHPYLHIFPALEEIVGVQTKKESTRDILYTPTWWGYPRKIDKDRFRSADTEETEQTRQTSFWTRSQQSQDISAGASRMTYFIYHPWFEPVFFEGESDTYRRAKYDQLYHSAQREVGRYWLQGTGPYWFGNNSTRGVLAETVAALMEKAVRPGSEPAQREWWPKDHREHRQYLFGEKPELWDWTMEEYIRTTTSITGKDKPDASDIRNHATPQVEWEIIHPQLPILKITAHADQRLPIKGPPPRPVNQITSETEREYVLFKRNNRNELRNLTEEEKLERFLEDLNERNMDNWKRSKGGDTKYSVSFVMSLQHRWTSFQDPNRWIVRFKEDMALYPPPHHVPDEESKITKELRRMEEEGKFVFPPAWDRYPHYWHNTDYMQHRIIGPVVLTVHESGALQPGNYSMTPRIDHWESPGHILTDEQLRKIPRYRITSPGPEPKNPDDDGVILWPHLMTPNAGFPLPGHVLVGPLQGPGTEPWREYGMEGHDW